MDVIKAVETYITRMVSEPSAMKVLLLDTHTVRASLLLLRYAVTKVPCIDSYCISGVHTVDTTIAPSVPHGPDRQQKARSNGSYEMRLLPPAKRRES